ncbi:hypothetical protein PBY51_022006 [Eleginops maclovinus]|uniref:Inositol monophosphatase 1 n=1 Tax=Eleginops maclovinus TaxID=56733 RepID=A0AAN7XHV4_ELEMC|nr:hypothetical protein PBY51_022006 [Eleginops maclovinus]
MVCTEFGSSRDPEVVEKILCSLRAVLSIPTHGVRGAGTAAINMCLVASGCVEAYYEIGIHVWDIAAGSLLVTEAGGGPDGRAGRAGGPDVSPGSGS